MNNPILYSANIIVVCRVWFEKNYSMDKEYIAFHVFTIGADIYLN